MSGKTNSRSPSGYSRVGSGTHGWAAIPALVLTALLLGPTRASAQAQSYEVVYTFSGGADGGSPSAGVIMDAAGNLYGTTTFGGSVSHPPLCTASTEGCGVIFKVDRVGQQTVLHTFIGSDGRLCSAPLLLDAAGNLYGTTSGGGPTLDSGVVFELDPAETYTVLHVFGSGPDGANPRGNLIRDSAGNLCGTTFLGGRGSAGVIFRLAPTGAETGLFLFDDTDGREPSAGVVTDADGNLYTATSQGGAADVGVLFELEKNGTPTVLYDFAGPTEKSQLPAWSGMWLATFTAPPKVAGRTRVE